MIIAKWTASAGSVVCRELGFPGPTVSSTGFGVSSQASGPQFVYLVGISCDGSEERLTDCAELSIGGRGDAGEFAFSLEATVFCQTGEFRFLSALPPQLPKSGLA